MTYFSSTGYMPGVVPPAPKPDMPAGDQPMHSCGGCGHCMHCCAQEDVPTPAPWPGVHKLVTGVCEACDPETGKPHLIEKCLVWNPECKKWEEKQYAIKELPTLYKAPVGESVVTLPSFDGPFEALDTDGNTITLYGSSEIPANMSGSILCMNGGMCYLPGNIPFPDIPVEIQCGGPQPAVDSGVKLWVDNGVAKTYNPEIDMWVQNTPYGA